MQNNFLKVEHGALNLVKKTLLDQGIHGKLLYIADPYVDVLYGDVVRDQLEELDEVTIRTDTINSIECAMNVASYLNEYDYACIIGLGGGRVLDVCKYAAHISKKPYLSIPTTAANDGMVSPIAVLMKEDGRPMSLGASMPTMTLIDIDVVASGPLATIKAGIGDTISNYMALKDWELAVERGKDTMYGYAYLMSKNSLDALMKTQFDTICPEFVEVLINSLVLSGIAMDFAGSSRPVSGSEHCFGHALDYYMEDRKLHGYQVALGTVAMLKMIGASCDEVIAYLKRFEVDVNPKTLGVDEDMFIKCMRNGASFRPGRYTYLDEVDLDDTGKLKRIYRELVEEL